MLIDLSLEESDPRVVQALLSQELDFATELNFVFDSEVCDDMLVQHVLWYYSNILGENNPEQNEHVLKRTQIIDFFCRIASTSKRLSPVMLHILPWVCINFVRLQPLPQPEIVTYDSSLSCRCKCSCGWSS